MGGATSQFIHRPLPILQAVDVNRIRRTFSCPPRMLLLSIVTALLVGWPARTGNADERSAEQVAERMRQEKQRTGVAPGLTKCRELMGGTDVKLNKRDMPGLWRAMQDLQKPAMSAKDLGDLIVAKRESIVDIRFRCLHTYFQDATFVEPDARAPARPPAEEAESEFAFSGDKLYLKTAKGKVQGSHDLVALSYDGTVVRRFEDDRRFQPQGSVLPFDRRSNFFKPENVLAAAMLLNCEVDCGKKIYSYDLCSILAHPKVIVFEEAETVGGTPCLVVSLGLQTAYLDPRRDYAVVKFDEHRVSRDNSPAVFELFYQKTLTGLVDYGNGLWLPREVVESVFRDGSVVKKTTTKVVEMAVNKGIDDKFFTNLTPVGTFVNNVVDGLAYPEGGEASIEKTLGQTADGVAKGARSSQFKTWIIVANLLAVFAFAIMFGIRKLRR